MPSGAAEADVEQRGQVPMNQLRMGDRVRVLTPKGHLAWEPIIVFGHQVSRCGHLPPLLFSVTCLSSLDMSARE